MNINHLSLIIKTLLQQLETGATVFINDLGEFSLKKEGARIEGNTIHPPQQKIAFTHTYEGSGFAFVLQFSKTENLTIAEANEIISNWTTGLKKAITENKSIEIEEFGTFYYNETQELTFTSAANHPFNIENEGLECIELGIKSGALSVGNGALEVESEELEVYAEVVDVETEVDKKIVDSEQLEMSKPEEEKDNISEEPPHSSTPDAHSSEPDTHNSEPDTHNSEPDAHSSEPDAHNSEPDAHNSEPDAHSSEPDAHSSEPDTHNSEPDAHSSEPGAHNSEPDAHSSEFKAQSPKNRRFEKWLFLLVIIITLATLAFLFKDHLTVLYQKHFEQPTEDMVTTKETTEQVVIENVSEELPADTIPEAVVDTIVTNIETPQETIVEEPTPTLNDGIQTMAFEKGKFYVIAGSFVKEELSMKHIKDKKLEHYNPVLITQKGNSRLRICIGIFTSEQEAQQFINQTNENYWILK